MEKNQAEPILIIEDEKEIRDLMALHLLRQSYLVKEVGSVEEGLVQLEKTGAALIILDWMLPGKSGIEFLGILKKQSSPPPVLMVTARSEPEDIVEGLESGADDFLTKPFEPSVLLARVKALLRRKEILKPNAQSATNEISIYGLSINPDTYSVLLENEKLHLTPSEFKLLLTMIQMRGRVLTRDQLIEEIQGEGINVVGRTIDTHVFGLRKKLGAWSDNVETSRGIGYRVRID